MSYVSLPELFVEIYLPLKVRKGQRNRYSKKEQIVAYINPYQLAGLGIFSQI